MGAQHVVGETVEAPRPKLLTVRESCDSLTPGRHYCSVHKFMAPNDIGRDGHDTDECKWLWWCLQHGAEAY